MEDTLKELKTKLLSIGIVSHWFGRLNGNTVIYLHHLVSRLRCQIVISSDCKFFMKRYDLMNYLEVSIKIKLEQLEKEFNKRANYLLKG